MSARIGSFLLLALLVAALPGTAAADRGYISAFSLNRQGDITWTGNTLLTCFDTDPLCAAARNGTASGSQNNNNERPMDWVDVDQDPDTFNSSTATLTLPAGAHVLEARLYYTGRLQQGATSGAFVSRPAPHPDRRNIVWFKPPGRGEYLKLPADIVDDAEDPGTHAVREYQGIVDVTDLVAAAGSGAYGVANVQLGTGLHADQAGGWALAVAYEDVDQSTRNLTVFDGFRFVLADGPPVDIPLSGFLTPPSGPVVTNLGLVAIEGDLGTIGDSATINAGTAQAYTLTNAGNPANNFFNASITDRTGALLTGRNPAHRNQLGFDVDTVNATGRLRNGQTNTLVRLATSGDGFAPNGVSFATNLYAPSLLVRKTVTPAGDAHLGDVLTYTVDVANVGLDAATNVVLTDAIPNRTSYVPGSLEVAGGAGAGPKSDAADTDVAEFDATANAVRFRLGTGANGTSGGRLEVPAAAPANATAIRFSVRVDSSGVPSGFQVTNSAGVGFDSATLGDFDGHVNSPDVITPVRVPDLEMDKSHTGELRPGREATFSLRVTNVGDAPTIGPATVTDTLPDELSFVGGPSGTGWDCSATSGRTLSCTHSGALAPGAAFPPITYVAEVALDAQPGDIVNTAAVHTPGDGDATNDSDTNTGTIDEPVVDLAIGKVALTPRVFPGGTVRFALVVRNHGPDIATDVTVHDRMPAGLTPVRLRSSRGSCAGTVCHLGTMRPGQRALIIVVAVAGDDTGGRRLRDVARVRATQRELNTRNNRDSAFVRVIPLVDLAVTKTTPEPSVPAGEPVSFDIVVENHGPSTATQVNLTDTLPAGLTLISATPLQGSCTGLTCALGALRAGASTQVTIEASSDPALAGQTVTNTARVAAREPELVLANNQATADVTFTALPPSPAPDISVTKSSDANVVNVGGEISYRIVATNAGAGAASAVVVTDTPDPRLQVLSVTPSQGTCAPAVPIVCELGALAPGASASVTVVARATAPGVLRNGVTAVTSPGSDDGDVKGAVATRAPALVLRKRAGRRTVRQGSELTYSLTVSARGTGTARSAEVCDTLPRHVTVTSLGGGRHRGARRVCWTLARLAAGRARTFRLRVLVTTARRPGRMTNLATLRFANRAARIARARVRVVHIDHPCLVLGSPVAHAAC